MQEALSMAVDRARISRMRDKSRSAQTKRARGILFSQSAYAISDFGYREKEREREREKRESAPLDKVPLESLCNARRDVQPGCSP